MRNRFRIAIVVVMIVGLAIAGETFYLLKQNLDIRSLNFQHAALLADMHALETELSTLQGNYQFLENEYLSLKDNNTILISDYLSLETAHDTLNTAYSRIQDDFTILETRLLDVGSKYSSLLEAYDLLTQFVDRPLTNKKIPSLYDLQTWLSVDETDLLTYHADFDCKDFATILAIKARTQQFDMGVVGIHGYNRDTSENYGHAVNAIITTDGLVYIEPQTDAVWWYTDHGEITEKEVHELGGVWIFVTCVHIILEY